jgi:hypothetical protein
MMADQIDQGGRRGRLGLRSGDWVVVRSKEEILATLDANGRLDELPFQPEMLAFCDKRMRVAKVAHKTCDNIRKTGGRRMHHAVHLQGARCDGAAHGGCQADCVFFWKEAWLKRADADSRSAPPAVASAIACTESMIRERVHPQGGADATDPAWVCQTTALYDATHPLAWWDVRQYVRDVTSGNHRAWHIVKLIILASYRKLVSLGIGYRLLIASYNKFQTLRGGDPYPLGAGIIPDSGATPTERLDLQPGEWVKVRPQEQILQTITASGFNRGMRYDLEMSKYCGKEYRVQMRVDRLINEQTGQMMQMKSPCIQLEDVYCRAECTPMRMGCPRASNTYWREIWLQRVNAPSSKPARSATRA